MYPTGFGLAVRVALVAFLGAYANARSFVVLGVMNAAILLFSSSGRTAAAM